MTCRCMSPVDITLYRDPKSAEGEAMRYFDRKGVRCEDADVTANPTALREMRALCGQAKRPVIVIDGRVIVGREPAVLEPLVPSRFLRRKEVWLVP